MITFEECVTIFLACRAKNNLFKCYDCPCNTIDFYKGDVITDLCNSLTSLRYCFNSRKDNGE